MRHTLSSWLLAVAAMFFLDVHANTVLVVTNTDGSLKKYEIDTATKLKIDRNYLVIEKAGRNEILRMRQIKKYSFEKDMSGMGSIEVHDDVRPFVYDGNTVTVSEAGAVVLLSDLAGRVVAQASQSPDGNAVISVYGLSAGVYILSINGEGYKIVKR